MADTHTGGAAAETHGHSDIAFEPRDINPQIVAVVGVFLLALGLGVAAFVAWLYLVLLRAEAPRKESQLPPAVVDQLQDRLPPQPRLEGIEDLRHAESAGFQIYPSRAKGFYDEQRKALESTAGGKLKIQDAITEAARVLPARKGDSAGREAPKVFMRRLPAKSASGSVELGDL